MATMRRILGLVAVCAGCGCTPMAEPQIDPPDTCRMGGSGQEEAPDGDPAIREHLDATRRQLNLPSVTLAAVDREGARLVVALGDADPMSGRAATPDTPYLLASVSKTVIGVLAQQAVERGEVDLDADVQGFVDFPVRHPSHPDRPITLRMLLTHSSTLWDTPPTWGSEGWTQGDATASMHDYVRDYFTPGTQHFGGADAWWDHEPGRFYCYSNMAIALAAVVLERAGGADLESLAHERIFAPLQMNHTTYRIDAWCDPDDLAVGASYDGRAFVADDNGRFGQPEGHPELASGMLRSTASDMLRLASAVADGGSHEGTRILTSASVDRMLRRQLDPSLPTCGDGRGSPGEQGLVWMHAPTAAGDWVGHYGGVEGFLSSMWVVPSSRLRYVIIVNASDPAFYTLEAELYTGLIEGLR